MVEHSPKILANDEKATTKSLRVFRQMLLAVPPSVSTHRGRNPVLHVHVPRDVVMFV